MRPPWALDEARFADLCEACGKCRTACPEKVLVSASGGLPQVSFESSHCTFCGACAEACPSGALSLFEEDGERRRAPWVARAAVASSCLSISGVACRVCGEQCEARAIRFQPALGGRSLPVVDAALCTGCGACVGPCPAKSITIH